jgi:glycosyltransferase involved in cell wall biosynthesis
MHNPKISVCIPTYNYGRYLPAAIESVLGQDYADFELLIIDDCSKDDSREVIARYAARDPRIVFHANPTNLGMVRNWNLCLTEARGEYVKFLFGDDLLVAPDALGRMAQVLDRDPQVALVASARKVIDADSAEQTVWSHFGDNERMPGPRAMSRCLLADKNLIGEPTVVMFRRALAGRGFNPAYRQLVDLEMWFHLFRQGEFAFIGAPLCAFRIHAGQQSALNARENASIDDLVLLLRDYLDEEGLGLSPLVRRYLRYDLNYRIWKAWRVDGKLGQAQAFEKINSSCATGRFYLIFPFYKMIKPLMKLHLKRLYRRL